MGFDGSKKSKQRYANRRTVPADGVGNVLIKTKEGLLNENERLLYGDS